MQSNVVTKEINLGDGRIITIETGKLARQADGAVVVRMGDTMLLATVVSRREAKEGVDFLPLSVDYQEKFAAAGRIPGGFIKREGRLSEHEILTSRLVDRALRPIFPSNYHADTQVAISLISGDKDVMPDALAALAASSAIAVSDIPFGEPISEVRVVQTDGQYIVNPNAQQTETADLNMIVAGTADNILMVEGSMQEVSEDTMLGAIKAAHEAIKLQCQAQVEMAQELGVTKREYDHEAEDQSLRERLFADYYDQVYAMVGEQIADKQVRKERFSAIKDSYIDSLPEEHGENMTLVHQYFSEIHKKAARNLVLDEKKRLDGRQLNEVRDHHHRGELSALCPRLSALHPRRNAVAHHRDARHQARPADDRRSHVPGQQQVLAPLQLSGIFYRGGEAQPRTRPPRDRSRQPGPPRTETRGAQGRG